MSRISLSLGVPTLADRLLGRGLAIDVILIFAGVAFTSIAAQVTIPTWSLSITGQTVAVLLVGLALGALRGAISLALYAVCGAAGLPIFSDNSSGLDWLAGSTGGFIIGFIGAAAFAGWMAEKALDRTPFRSFAIAVGGTAIIYLFGLPALAIARSLNFEQTLQMGLYPMLVGAVVKALVVTAVHTASWAATRRMETRDAERAAQPL